MHTNLKSSAIAPSIEPGRIESPRASGRRAADAGRGSDLFELALTALVVASVGVVAWRFAQTGYLPQPFFYRKSDTLMDWYNTAYWANRAGAYDVWRTVYAPLSFDFLRLFSLHGCYRFGPEAARDCDWLGRTVLAGFAVLNTALVYAAYRKAGGRTAWMRATATSFGLPMLFAFERGNLIVPCFTFFVLAYGGLLRPSWQRWLALALAMNFKPYLVGALIPSLVRHRWRWAFGAALAGGLIYLVSYAAEGAGGPAALLRNAGAFYGHTVDNYWNNLYSSTSYISLAHSLPAGFPFGSRLSPLEAQALRWALIALIGFGLLGIAVAFVAVARRPLATSTHRLAALALSGVLTTAGASGYIEVLLLFLVFLEPWRGAARLPVLAAAYLLCVSLDLILFPIPMAAARSWLGGRQVTPIAGVALGQLLRPGLILVIQYGLIAATLADVGRIARRDPAAPARALEGIVEGAPGG